MRLSEVFLAEITDYYLKNHTFDGVYLVFYAQNQNMACGEIEKRLGFQVTAEDSIEFSILKYDDYKSALQGFGMIGELGVSPEIWVNGRRKKKTK